MYTSYFFSKKIDLTMNLVGISRSIPGYLKGRIKAYKPLCPPWPLISSYKDNKIDRLQYEEEYRNTVLNKLDPHQVYQDLGHDAVLLCWEQPDKFCHRHIAADWLSSNLGIEINEL